MKNTELKISKNFFVKHLWLVLGFISTVLGVLGYIIPMMPGTTFIIIALYCFARSNEKWHNWLLNNKYFGQSLRDFKEGRGMTLKAKIKAIICISISIGISMCFASNVYVILFLILFATIAYVAVLKQKTKK
jgi:uncharacterized membrane protein YbaN (DUF454 family)